MLVVRVLGLAIWEYSTPYTGCLHGTASKLCFLPVRCFLHFHVVLAVCRATKA